jgi:hypothetical protein
VARVVVRPDAADQQPLADAVLEQRHSGVQPRAAAGQGDNAVGLGRDIGRGRQQRNPQHKASA